MLSAYLDGELMPDERPGIESHLALCGSCREELETLRNAKQVLAGAPRREIPPELIAKLEGRFLRPSWWSVFKSSLLLPRVWVPAGAMGLVATLLLGVWIGWRQFRAPELLPLEALLAAHSRYVAEGLVSHGGLATSNFSAQLALFHTDEEG